MSDQPTAAAAEPRPWFPLVPRAPVRLVNAKWAGREGVALSVYDHQKRGRIAVVRLAPDDYRVTTRAENVIALGPPRPLATDRGLRVTAEPDGLVAQIEPVSLPAAEPALPGREAP